MGTQNNTMVPDWEKIILPLIKFETIVLISLLPVISSISWNAASYDSMLSLPSPFTSVPEWGHSVMDSRKNYFYKTCFLSLPFLPSAPLCPREKPFADMKSRSFLSWSITRWSSYSKEVWNVKCIMFSGQPTFLSMSLTIWGDENSQLRLIKEIFLQIINTIKQNITFPL